MMVTSNHFIIKITLEPIFQFDLVEMYEDN